MMASPRQLMRLSFLRECYGNSIDFYEQLFHADLSLTLTVSGGPRWDTIAFLAAEHLSLPRWLADLLYVVPSRAYIELLYTWVNHAHRMDEGDLTPESNQTHSMVMQDLRSHHHMQLQGAMRLVKSNVRSFSPCSQAILHALGLLPGSAWPVLQDRFSVGRRLSPVGWVYSLMRTAAPFAAAEYFPQCREADSLVAYCAQVVRYLVGCQSESAAPAALDTRNGTPICGSLQHSAGCGALMGAGVLLLDRCFT